MIEFIAKRLPSFQLILGLTVSLGVLFFFNWFMSNSLGENIVKYNDECVVGEYSTETNTGTLTCGEYEKDDGEGEISGFVGKVYISGRSVFCKITENEYTGSINWDCHTDDPDEPEEHS